MFLPQFKSKIANRSAIRLINGPLFHTFISLFFYKTKFLIENHENHNLYRLIIKIYFMSHELSFNSLFLLFLKSSRSSPWFILFFWNLGVNHLLATYIFLFFRFTFFWFIFSIEILFRLFQIRSPRLQL